MPKRAHILIVEDEPHALKWLGAALEAEGRRATLAATGEAALAAARAEPPDLVLLDIRLPDVDGLVVFERLIEAGSDATVIVMTADSSSANAIQAMRLGAFEYIAKPIDLDHLLLLIERALGYRALERELRELRGAAGGGEEEAPPGLIGRTAAMREVYKRIGRVAATDTTVLVTGESGSGKELVVDAIHAFSRRAAGPLVKVNCAAIPEALLESELFGHERGAFTDAVARRLGRFEQAAGGTLLLDEAAELPLALQAKLLRAIQERRFSRVGSNQPLEADFRLVAATARDLAEAVAAGAFREDLYYRLNVFTIRVPPLRERRDDIPLLVSRFLARAETPARLTPEALDRLLDYDWPGNVRELENVIARAIVLSPGGAIAAEAIQFESAQEDRASHWTAAVPLEDGLPAAVRALERALIERALARAGGNKVRAAELLRLPRRSLYNKLAEYEFAAE